MTEQGSRSLDEIAYDPKPGDRVRVEDGRGLRVYAVRDVRYSDVICDIEGIGEQHVALAEWYAMCRNTPGDVTRIDVITA